MLIHNDLDVCAADQRQMVRERSRKDRLRCGIHTTSPGSNDF